MNPFDEIDERCCCSCGGGGVDCGGVVVILGTGAIAGATAGGVGGTGAYPPDACGGEAGRCCCL